MEPDSSAVFPGLVFVGQPPRRRSRSSSSLAAKEAKVTPGRLPDFPRRNGQQHFWGKKNQKNAVSLGREAESSYEVANEGQQRILLR